MQRIHLPLTLAACLAATAIACTNGDRSAPANSADTAVATSMTKPAANAEVAERTADSAQAVGVPTAVADVGTHGEDLYDQVKAGNWSKARVIMDSLDQSAAALSTGDRAQLAAVLDTLHRAVAARQGAAAIVAANRVTFVGAKLTEAYHPKMPADIVRLDYYGRELEIWAARGNTARLAATATDIRKTWDAIRPQELSHGGAAAAARMDNLVARLAVATTPAQYAKLATPILDEVDALEKPFEK